jgi:hypothetical protein
MATASSRAGLNSTPDGYLWHHVEDERVTDSFGRQTIAGILEEFRARVLQADREGQPGVYLHTLPKPDRENHTAEVHGLVLPKRHPSIIFGNGGSLKSYEALYVAGALANEGIKPALFDWELAGEDEVP